MAVTFKQGADLSDTAIRWEEHDHSVIAFDNGWTFVGELYYGTELLFTKTSGFTPADTDPNLTLSWPTAGELNDLLPNRTYDLRITATRDSDQRERKMDLTIVIEDSVAIEIGPHVGPCETWPYVRSDDLDIADEALVAQAATHVLWALSGYQHGFCNMVLRPCARSCTTWEPYLWTPPTMFATSWSYGWGAWPACGCSRRSRGCSCADLPTLRLPSPIARLDQVRVDGVDLDLTTDVRVSQWRDVQRIDGGTFPACQDFTVADGDGVCIVRLRRGRAVPALGQLAMGELVGELSRSFRGQPCGLSPRAKEVTRKGVTQVQFDPQVFLDKGRTGLPICDLFIGVVNPTGQRRAPRVYRADDSHRGAPGPRPVESAASILGSGGTVILDGGTDG